MQLVEIKLQGIRYKCDTNVKKKKQIEEVYIKKIEKTIYQYEILCNNKA